MMKKMSSGSLNYFTPSTHSINLPNVFIYAGPGASKSCLIHTERTIKLFLNDSYNIKYISSEPIINDDWEENTALLVIPGGADIPYNQSLNGQGNKRIRTYVENGGSYLGICAGSYYAGSYVEFAKGTPLEVLGQRELAFFSGIVQGPILASYDYQSEAGAKAAKILWQGFEEPYHPSVFTVYYNGGGHFVDAHKMNNTHVLAYYEGREDTSAIIECQVGLGKVILSGVHFEFDSNLLDSRDEYLKEIIPSLKKGESMRQKLVGQILQRLNLECSETLLTVSQ